MLAHTIVETLLNVQRRMNRSGKETKMEFRLKNRKIFGLFGDTELWKHK